MSGGERMPNRAGLGGLIVGLILMLLMIVVWEGSLLLVRPYNPACPSPSQMAER
jgi:amino acid permease